MCSSPGLSLRSVLLLGNGSSLSGLLGGDLLVSVRYEEVDEEETEHEGESWQLEQVEGLGEEVVDEVATVENGQAENLPDGVVDSDEHAEGDEHEAENLVRKDFVKLLN